MELAKAGSGHYVPGNEAGQAVAGCSRFKIAFVLKDDPRYPTLSRRARQLGSQPRARAESLQQQARLVQHPPDFTHFVPGDPQSLEQLRQFIAVGSAIVSDYEAFLVEFIGKTDELGRSNDVSETERNAFSQFWQKERAYLGEVRAALLDARALLGTLTELADYVENTQPACHRVNRPIHLLNRRAFMNRWLRTRCDLGHRIWPRTVPYRRGPISSHRCRSSR